MQLQVMLQHVRIPSEGDGEKFDRWPRSQQRVELRVGFIDRRRFTASGGDMSNLLVVPESFSIGYHHLSSCVPSTRNGPRTQTTRDQQPDATCCGTGLKSKSAKGWPRWNEP
jgi:hypothetical protein